MQPLISTLFDTWVMWEPGLSFMPSVNIIRYESSPLAKGISIVLETKDVTRVANESVYGAVQPSVHRSETYKKS